MNIANRITISRLIIAALMIFFVVFPWWPSVMTSSFSGQVLFSPVDLIACLLFIIGSITDALDGHYARKHNLVTDFGKFVDPLADKFLVNSALILLAVKNPNALPVLIVILMIGRDLAVDGIKLLAASKGQVVAANIFGKLKTVFQMVTIPFIFLNGFPFHLGLSLEHTNIILIVLASITCAMSIVSGAIYLYKGKDLLKGGK